MYRQHFGLVEHPFSLTPDTQFFFNSQSHREVLSTLLLALRHSENQTLKGAGALVKKIDVDAVTLQQNGKVWRVALNNTVIRK